MKAEKMNPEKRCNAFRALVEANSGKEDFPVSLGYIDEAADGSVGKFPRKRGTVLKSAIPFMKG